MITNDCHVLESTSTTRIKYAENHFIRPRVLLHKSCVITSMQTNQNQTPDTATMMRKVTKAGIYPLEHVSYLF